MHRSRSALEVSVVELAAPTRHSPRRFGVSPHGDQVHRQRRVMYDCPADQLGQVIEPRHVAMMMR
jgi:hypothetical protein